MMSYVRCRLVGVLLVGGLGLALAGCNQSKAPREAATSATSRDADDRPSASEESPTDEERGELARNDAEPRAAEAAEEAPPEAEDPAEAPPAVATKPAAVPLEELQDDTLTMPTVTMTEAHANSCLVKVGDSFPPLTLPDLAGETKPLAGLLGEKLTVVLYWNGGKPTALEALGELQREVASRFAGNGVNVVAINSGEESPAAGELAKNAGVGFPVLHDADSAALKQVTTGNVPRTFLLDASGKVLWLDLEYSWTTRRDLSQAIRYQLTR